MLNLSRAKKSQVLRGPGLFEMKTLHPMGMNDVAS